ncbi:MAG: zinc ABC transporter substrate-binding protein, partial [Candidatus Sumerlaeia bacterium]|nr:zinc ABC transporter substrate-binding protein [Candidatus Sumerlaeia bacterium]
VTLPTGRVVNTSSAFRSDKIVIEDAVLHHHGDGHYHSHDGYDPHTWLDPVQAIRQADAARRAIADLIPNAADAIRDRHGDLDAELKELHTSFLAATDPLKDTAMLASHPVYDYFARRYQLDVRSLHLEPDIFPTEEEWAELDELLEEQPARIMLWEDYPLAETVTELSNRGLSVIVFHTCISKPDDGDFMELMRANARRLSDAIMVIE